MSYHKVRCLFLLFIIFSIGTSKAEIQNSPIKHKVYTFLLNKTYGERAFDLWNIYDNIIRVSKPQKGLQKLRLFQDFCNKSNDISLQIEADLIEAVYLILHQPRQKKQILSLLNKVIFSSKKSNITEQQARALKTKAGYYWDYLQQYEAAFMLYQQELDLIQPLPFKAFPDKVFDLYHVGECYYYFSDYKKAISYFKKVTSYKQGTHKSIDYYITHAYNTLSVCYRKTNQLDSSDFYLKKLRVLKANDKQWLGIIDGNLGYNFYLKGNFEAAEPLLKSDVKTALEYSDFNLASGSAMTLANIYLKQKDNKQAIDWILKSKEYVGKSNEYATYKKLYPLLSKYYIIVGNNQKAKELIDSALFVRDSLFRKFNALQLLRAKQKADIIKNNAALKAANDKEKLKTLQLNILLISFVIAVFVALYIHRLQKKKHALQNLLNQRQLSEKDNEILKAAHELENFKTSILQKNKTIAELEKQLKDDNNNSQLLHNLEELRKITIITEQDWDNFRTLFDKVNNGYIHHLKTEFPNITPAEVRFLALKKLNFSYNEMATALGISPQSVRTIAYRMRKKNIIAS